MVPLMVFIGASIILCAVYTLVLPAISHHGNPRVVKPSRPVVRRANTSDSFKGAMTA